MIDFDITGMTESTPQHQEDILTAHKGLYKFTPQIGVGISNYINASGDISDLNFEVIRNFKTDGMSDINVTKDNDNKISIDAHY